MQKFLIPKDKEKFVKWLLENAITLDWTIVLEYSGDATYKFLIQNATKVTIPSGTQHHYDNKFKLTAIKRPILNELFISRLIRKCSALSVYNNKEIIFLIADDFHEECFSCTINFYENYYEILKDQNLIIGS